MTCEPPVFKKCCFCLPLHCGLITYGILRLIVMVLFALSVNLGDYTYYDPEEWKAIVIVITVFAVVDIILTIVFVFGGFANHITALKVFMWYMVVGAVLTVVGAALSSVLMTHGAPQAMDIGGVVFNVVLQLYIVFCIRSHIVAVKSLRNPGAARYDLVNQRDPTKC